MRDKIIIIEDDAARAAGLGRALASQQRDIRICGKLADARKLMAGSTPALIILDVNLPDGSGFEFLKELRQQSDVPVILLTANDMETDIVSGLEMGAVLRARVNTQLRRKASQQTAVCLGKYRFDFQRMEFYAEGRPVELSKTEQKLLRIFIENRGITLSRGSLVDRVWTDGAEYVDENALSVTVKRLRDKLGAKDDIKTVYGKGYMWVKEDE